MANNDDELNKLCEEYSKESFSGRISFNAGFYPKLCKLLGIEYKNLSRTGKAVLRDNAITTSLRRSGDDFQDGHYYEKL